MLSIYELYAKYTNRPQIVYQKRRGAKFDATLIAVNSIKGRKSLRILSKRQ